MSTAIDIYFPVQSAHSLTDILVSAGFKVVSAPRALAGGATRQQALWNKLNYRVIWSADGPVSKQRCSVPLCFIGIMKRRPKQSQTGNEFKWSDMEVWEPKIRELMADVLNDRVLVVFHDDPPEFVVGDDLSWLDKIIRTARGTWSGNVHDVLTERIAKNYRFVIGFHACRPVSLDDYRRSGLRVCDPNELNGIAREIFGDTAEVNAAIEHLAIGEGPSRYSYREHNSGSIYFGLSLEELVQSCGQYLLYGSEYILCIGAYLRREEELRKRGRATVIECRVPIEVIPKNYLRYLAGEVLEEIFERELDPEHRRIEINFGFPVRSNISADHIVTFHHPRRIPNNRKCRMLEN